MPKKKPTGKEAPKKKSTAKSTSKKSVKDLTQKNLKTPAEQMVGVSKSSQLSSVPDKDWNPFIHSTPNPNEEHEESSSSEINQALESLSNQFEAVIGFVSDINLGIVSLNNTSDAMSSTLTDVSSSLNEQKDTQLVIKDIDEKILQSLESKPVSKTTTGSVTKESGNAVDLTEPINSLLSGLDSFVQELRSFIADSKESMEAESKTDADVVDESEDKDKKIKDSEKDKSKDEEKDTGVIGALNDVLTNLKDMNVVLLAQKDIQLDIQTSVNSILEHMLGAEQEKREKYKPDEDTKALDGGDEGGGLFGSLFGGIIKLFGKNVGKFLGPLGKFVAVFGIVDTILDMIQEWADWVKGGSGDVVDLIQKELGHVIDMLLYVPKVMLGVLSNIAKALGFEGFDKQIEMLKGINIIGFVKDLAEKSGVTGAVSSAIGAVGTAVESTIGAYESAKSAFAGTDESESKGKDRAVQFLASHIKESGTKDIIEDYKKYIAESDKEGKHPSSREQRMFIEYKLKDKAPELYKKYTEEMDVLYNKVEGQNKKGELPPPIPEKQPQENFDVMQALTQDKLNVLGIMNPRQISDASTIISPPSISNNVGGTSVLMNAPSNTNVTVPNRMPSSSDLYSPKKTF